MLHKKTFIYSACALFVILLVAYANHFNNGFHFDDSHTIVNNGSIRSLKNIPSFFSDPSTFSASPYHGMYRPLITTSLAIDYWIAGGYYPFMFQLSTFLWHIGLCIMIFYLFKQLLSKTIPHQWNSYIALFGAGLFGLHTVNAETINYIISRSDVLSTFFIVASLLTFIAYPQKRKYYLYIFLAVIGVFIKETVMVLLVLMFFYILFFESELSIADIFKVRNIKKVGAIFLKMLPIVIILTGLQVYAFYTMTGAAKTFGISNPYIPYWLTQTYVWFHYFRSFFFPFDLSADTDLTVITNFTDYRIIIGVIFIILYLITIFISSKKKETRPIAYGLIWFGASLLPTSVAPFAEVMNDHRMYFAFVGLTISTVWIVYLLILKKEAYFTKPSKLKMLGLMAFLIIGINALGVYKRGQVWDSDESLWKDVTEKSPKNGRGWMNYGLTQMSKGDYGKAIELFNKALEFNPNYSTLFINLGIANGGIGNHEKAVKNFNQAIVLDAGNDASYTFFARYYLEQNNYLKAKELAEKAIALNSKSYMAFEIAMAAAQALGQWNELNKLAQQTLTFVPNDAKALQYRTAAAKRESISTPKIITQSASSEMSVNDLINLSLQQYSAGKYEDCIATCEIVNRIAPENADAYNNICAAYNMLKQWDKAKEACKKALLINPHHANAPANLKWAEAQKL